MLVGGHDERAVEGAAECDRSVTGAVRRGSEYVDSGGEETKAILHALIDICDDRAKQIKEAMWSVCV